MTDTLAAAKRLIELRNKQGVPACEWHHSDAFNWGVVTSQSDGRGSCIVYGGYAIIECVPINVPNVLKYVAHAANHAAAIAQLAIDQAARIAELEAENAALVTENVRLSSELHTLQTGWEPESQ